MNNFTIEKKQIILLILFILLLFLAILGFTRPAFLVLFDLSDKGQIGDVIGGITSPFINLLGAILVYASFIAQVRANKKQFEILNNEIVESGKDRNYEVSINLFRDLKSDYTNLSFGKNTGHSALSSAIEWMNRFNYKVKEFEMPIKSFIANLQFILVEYVILTDSLIENKLLRKNEVKNIARLIISFYDTFLKDNVIYISKKSQNHYTKNNWEYINDTFSLSYKIAQSASLIYELAHSGKEPD